MLDYINMEPMRYWQPDSELRIEEDVLNNPEKYSDYIGSFKKDGEWSRVIKVNSEVIIQSRSISKKTGEYARKDQSLPHLVEVFKKLPNNTVILGEICYDDLYKRSKDVGSILRCLPEKAIERQSKEEDKLHFYLFDVLCWDDEDLINIGFEDRIKKIGLAKELLGDRYIRYCEVKSTTEISKEYHDYLSKGGEGFVLQKRDCKYTPGKRTAWNTMKLKKSTEELELKVIGTIEPEMEYTGKEADTWCYYMNGIRVTKYFFKRWKAGVIVDHNGTKCYVASGITDSDAEWLSTPEAISLINEGRLYAKVQAMEIESDTGSLRHPRLLELRSDI